MAIQQINNGTNTGGAANDGTGDSLRQAADKINANFAEIASLVGTSDMQAKLDAQDDTIEKLTKRLAKLEKAKAK